MGRAGRRRRDHFPQAAAARHQQFKAAPAGNPRAAFPRILEAAHVGVGICEVEIIDGINIYHATHAAMCEAVAQLPVKPDAVLIDGNRCPKLDLPAEPLVGGDGLSIAIAAASIIAKVTRDRIMCELSLFSPLMPGRATRVTARASTPPRSPASASPRIIAARSSPCGSGYS